MARATTTKTAARKTRVKPQEAPRRKPGRPVGSTNAKRIAASPVKAAKAPVKRVVVAKPSRTAKPTKAVKPAAAAPKMSKAELEVHVVKLERMLVKLREKNKELKAAAPKTAAVVEPAAPEPAPEPAKPARKARRSKTVAPSSVDDDAPMEM